VDDQLVGSHETTILACEHTFVQRVWSSVLHVSPRSRSRALRIAVAAAFAASAAALFVSGEERDGALAFFIAWLAVHVLYGLVSGSFWALLIVVTCPPLLVAPSSGAAGESPLWLQAAFVGAFYGVPFAFAGVLARRIWQLRRRHRALIAELGGEEPPA
jgi:hypothetical protein